LKATALRYRGNAPGAATSFTGTAPMPASKWTWPGFEGVVYGYYGKGVGTTGLYILPTSAIRRDAPSDGGYVQATYKFDKLKLGLSYGISELKLAGRRRAASPSTLLKRNSSGVVGLYYSLTKSVTLVGEYIDTKSQAWDSNSATEKDFALGGILFF
jgi:hypothetical protein